MSKAAERVELGTSGIETSRLALGTVPLGGFPTAVSESDAADVLLAALEQQVTYFDTAPLYGFGSAEERIGTFLETHDRDAITLATKVGRLLTDRPPAGAEVDTSADGIYPDAPPLVPVWDFSYAGVRTSLEESYRRLRTARVDVVNIHDPDNHLEEALNGAYPALAELREAGAIGAIGAGMNQSAALTILAKHAHFDCFLLAGKYTLLDQSALHDLLPRASAQGVSIIIGTALHSGLLAHPVEGVTFNYRPASGHAIAKAQELARVCGKYEVPLPAAALQFPLGHPAVAAVVVGVRTRRELEENVRLLDWPIPNELWRELQRSGLLADEAPVPAVT